VPPPRQLVHTEWFDHALQALGALPQIDALLADELYRLAKFADLVPRAAAGSELRLFQTKEFLLRDGQIVRVLIYFVLRANDAVELQHIELIAEDMMADEP
jgi:hypothetical protein